MYGCIYTLQVGWWKSNEGETKKVDEYDSVQPVYMDVWRKEYVRTGAKGVGLAIGDSDEILNGSVAVPRTSLYIKIKGDLGDKGEMQDDGYSRVYITRTFDTKDAITGAARDDYDSEFLGSIGGMDKGYSKGPFSIDTDPKYMVASRYIRMCSLVYLIGRVFVYYVGQE
jgi:hypothetical protein